MRSQFFLIPAAVVASVASAPAAHAEVYMDIGKAQELMFPGATFSENFLTLNQDQYNAIITASDVVPYSRNIKAWRVSTGGWFIIDQVRGKDDWITYALAIDAAGTVRHIEILECLEHYDGIRNPAWLAQFLGRKQGVKFNDVATISGATLSAGQMTAGVKRLLATYTVVLAQTAGTS
jgi:hypothetical protein